MQRERPLWLQDVPAEDFSSRPGASGEQTGRGAALPRTKRQGTDFPAIWVVPRSFLHSLRPFVGAEAVFVLAPVIKISRPEEDARNHEERYSYAMDRFE